MSIVKVDGYSTHIEALAFCFMRTHGPVVELGAGWYSTPVLHGLCEAAGRDMLTIESEADWLQEFTAWETPWHRLTVDGRFTLPKGPLGLVLVDHGDLDRRAESVMEAKMRAQIVVIHDSQEELRERFLGLDEALEAFTYRRDWSKLHPQTSALSDTVPL